VQLVLRDGFGRCSGRLGRASSAGRTPRYRILQPGPTGVLWRGTLALGPETYVRSATASGLDPDRTEQMLASAESSKLAQPDFTLARNIGATTYPTLLLIDGSNVQRLPATGTSLEVMNRELTQALAAHESPA